MILEQALAHNALLPVCQLVPPARPQLQLRVVDMSEESGAGHLELAGKLRDVDFGAFGLQCKRGLFGRLQALEAPVAGRTVLGHGWPVSGTGGGPGGWLKLNF